MISVYISLIKSGFSFKGTIILLLKEELVLFPYYGLVGAAM